MQIQQLKQKNTRKEFFSSHDAEDKNTIQNEQVVHVNEFAGFAHQI